MKLVLRAKFSQHTHLMGMLLDTGDALLVEDSPHDAFWGIGRDGTGKNQLGLLLQETRAELRASSISLSTFTLSHGLPGFLGKDLNLSKLRIVPSESECQTDLATVSSKKTPRRSDEVSSNRPLNYVPADGLRLCQVSSPLVFLPSDSVHISLSGLAPGL